MHALIIAFTNLTHNYIIKDHSQSICTPIHNDLCNAGQWMQITHLTMDANHSFKGLGVMYVEQQSDSISID